MSQMMNYNYSLRIGPQDHEFMVEKCAQHGLVFMSSADVRKGGKDCLLVPHDMQIKDCHLSAQSLSAFGSIKIPPMK